MHTCITMLISIALMVWYSKYVQAAVRLFMKKIWPKIDKPVLKFWNERVLPFYRGVKNTYYKIKKFIKWVKVVSKKIFYFLIWMFSSLQNTVTTIKTVFAYLIGFLKFNRIWNRSYFLNFLAFYIKNSIEYFYFFKWSFLNSISYTIFSLANYINTDIYKNKIFDLTLPFSHRGPVVQWIFFNFFKKGNYLSKLGILKKSDFKELELSRRYSRQFPRYFSIAFEHSILKQRAEFSKVSINTLKYAYRDFNENIFKLPDFLESSGFYKKSGELRDKQLATTITFLFFYRFAVKKPVILFNFIKDDLYFNLFTKCGKEFPITPRRFFRHLVINDAGDWFISRFIQYTTFMTLTPKLIHKPIIFTPLDSAGFWGRVLDNKKPLTNLYPIQLVFKNEILEELRKIRLHRTYNAVSNYKAFYTNMSFYFTKYYEYFFKTTNPTLYRTSTDLGTTEIYYGSSPRDQIFSNYPVKVKSSFVEFIGKYWPTRFNPSNFYKFNDLVENQDNTNMFLRKNKIFNKSRYSRNRQIYRTGVYLCLYINVIFVYFYIFAFYRFAFVFGYLWLGIGLLIISMTLGRAMKYRFYNPITFYTEFLNFLNWFSFLIYNGWVALKKFFKKQSTIFHHRFIIMLNFDDIFQFTEKSKNSPEKKRFNLYRYKVKCRKYFGHHRKYLFRMALNTPEDYKTFWFILRPRTLRFKLKQRLFLRRNIIKQKYLNFNLVALKLYWGRI